jgi:hypothetical protein
MTERVLGPSGGRRRKRLAIFVPVLALAALVLAIAAAAGPVGDAAGFEDDDGNLIDNAATGIDWNNFNTSPGSRTWTGTAPDRAATGSASGFTFVGLEDAQETTADDGFAGGTKQDDNCASVNGSKAPNKDDLKRIYLATKTVSVSGSDHVFLELAWVRIPQNTTSASAHIGFEFNKGTGPACPAGSNGLVSRVAGDMLVVYDFEGSSTDDPTLTLRRWVTSGACEISSNSAPCWGPATNLTALGFAEAKVNTFGTVSDTVAPSTETLGTNEFGEAGIDLTAAGVFSAGACESFGKAYAVSRSSGNSGTAQMKDLVGPANFNLQNCGSVKIIKQTDPRGLNQNFGFTSNLAGAQMTCTGDTTPAAFNLNDNGNTGKTLGSNDPAQNSAGNTESCINVPAGSYTVTEGADPAGFAFDSVTCSSTGAGTSTSTSGKVASITLAGGGSVICRYENNQQLGAIKVTKTRKNASATSGNPLSQPHQGVSFTVNGVTKTTNGSGIACFDGLTFGAAGTAYNVVETVPSGYAGEGGSTTTVTKSVTVNNGASCADATYVGENVSFHNSPLTDLSIDVTADDPGATKSTVSCVNSSSASVGTPITTPVDPANFDANNLPIGTYTCTIVIDP